MSIMLRVASALEVIFSGVLALAGHYDAALVAATVAVVFAIWSNT